MESWEERQKVYAQSIADPNTFWSEVATKNFFWKTPFPTDKQCFDYNFDKSQGKIFANWFDGGVTNVCYNCVDRHLEKNKDRVAFYWEGNEVGEGAKFTYQDMFNKVTELSGALKQQYNIQKGDRVSLYLPMIIEAPVVMLALARIGAVASVIFGGFSGPALASRLVDSGSKLLITCDGTMRGDKPIRLKSIADEAMTLAAADGLKDLKCLVIERHGRTGVPMTEGRDDWYSDVLKKTKPCEEIEWVEAEHPLFMLYTSGSTGKPKGLLHTTAGYMIYAATTFKNSFQYKANDIYFCTADVGWITGHSYVVYGPMCNCAQSVLFEGLPTYPTASRWWEICDKYQVSIFYTAPTAIRSLMKAGETAVKACNRKSLRVLATVGEPINVSAWKWYHDVVGEGRCDIIDTFWQTETGGHMITPMAGATPLKPGSATYPSFGIQPEVCTTEGKPLADADPVDGLLCFKAPWPGMARTIYGDHSRYENVYFTTCPGLYFTGDGCRRDEDGCYWITGRVDDVINVSGHRIGTGEVESAINQDPNVVESAVVGFPHDIKGEGIYAFVTFKTEVEVTDKIIASVRATVRHVIGPIASPDCIQPAPGLPKTRSGKIMRRILRKIAAGLYEEFGDTTTLADPGVVDELIALKDKFVLKKAPSASAAATSTTATTTAPATTEEKKKEEKKE